MRLKRHRIFIKDFKKVRLADSQFEKLIQYLNSLKDNKPLPAEAKDHSLSGEYQDCREFHLGGDVLIIYLEKPKTKEVILLRIGTHSQLFK